MCSEPLRGVMLQYLGALLISGAYAFWTCCDFRIKYCDSGLSGWLPWSSRLLVNIYTNFSIHSQCNLLTNSVKICKVMANIPIKPQFRFFRLEDLNYCDLSSLTQANDVRYKFNAKSPPSSLALNVPPQAGHFAFSRCPVKSSTFDSTAHEGHL